MNRTSLRAFAGLLGLVSFAAAQGTDSCSSPTPIAGLGTFAWTNTSATDSPESQAGCIAIRKDVWFAWTAPSTGSFEVNSCNLAAWDTAFAAYNGGACPTGPSIACNDDSCGLQTRITFSAVAGNVYSLQMGSFGVTAGGSGQFQIAPGGGGPMGCSPAQGPDVIVGDVSDVGNYASAGGIEALALGTTSCNMGNAGLNWFASTNQHPVIGGNLYRYKQVDGAWRFEQVGQSWLKHGFAAVSGSLCCTCTGSGGGQLGVGCSDPYSSGLNGSQSGLGPRWQVNASNGVFTYPPANPAWSGSTARRIEVLLADVELTGTAAATRYFGEAQYVTPDDAAAGNQNNNASWREITVAGSGSAFTFSLLGSTQRTQSAIRAWAQIDPLVVLDDVQVANDGLFVVGSRAYDLGGGVWRYEYAVYNMNSHRSGGTFTVPVPAGANVTNVGFHDVVYRNGDGPGNTNVSGADWTPVVGASSITWSTETEAQNAGANALRWGTTYNFRFDCDIAPANGSVDLGLWRGGSPGFVAAEARVPGPQNGSSAICSGDGTGAACPCGNTGAAGSGCVNSLGVGATLFLSGTASVSADTLLLSGSNMPETSCLYFQGTSAIQNGAGVAFGDGLRCAGGFNARLGTKSNVLGASSYPSGGDPAVSVRGSCSPSDVRVYQVWYRNAAAFCTPETFNLSNGWQIVWQS